MFDKLKSTLSTVTSTLQAVRELPEAIRARSKLEQRANEWKHLFYDRKSQLDVERFANNEQWDWAKERIESLQSSVSDWRGKHKDISKQLAMANNELQRLGRELNEARQAPEDPECEDYPEGPRTWRRAWKMLKKERGKWQKEREDLRAKLARYEAAEKWHQVTAGEGELPPPIPVLWRDNHPDFPPGELNYCIQGACGHYEWRFLSSVDVLSPHVRNLKINPEDVVWWNSDGDNSNV